MSRPSKLTPTVQDKIIKAIGAGNFRYVAAGFANVPVKTFDHWMARGRKGDGKLYADFARAVEQAETEAEVRQVARIMKAAEEDPRCAMWWLERKFPEHWGRREHRTVDTTVKHDAGERGQGFSVEWLGGVLAPFPEAKAAVGAAIQALLEERKKKQIEDKG